MDSLNFKWTSFNGFSFILAVAVDVPSHLVIRTGYGIRLNPFLNDCPFSLHHLFGIFEDFSYERIRDDTPEHLFQ